MLGIELYSTKVAVAWRLAPEPDYEILFHEELAAQDNDLEGVSDLERGQLRTRLLQRLKAHRRHLRLADDAGTEYHQTGAGSSVGGGEHVGRSQFAPAIPKAATRLSIFWDELEFDVALPPRTSSD
jgi:hypothetical protein